MNNLTDVSYIKSLLTEEGFHFSKALGQNFLINPTVCPKMAQMSGLDAQSGVLEIGPGVGVLTKELCLRAKKVVAVELDRRLQPVLAKTLAEYPNHKIVWGDALKLDLHELIRQEFTGMDVYVCANLPYYITSQVLMRLLEEKLPIRAITVMVQKEAAAHICALPGERESGALSAAVRFYSVPQVLFGVSRGSFMPAPNVDSAVIRLDICTQPAVEVAQPQWYFKTVKAAFGQRRKTLHNSLAAGLGISKPTVEALLAKADIAPSLRAEQLTLQQFGALANQVARCFEEQK